MQKRVRALVAVVLAVSALALLGACGGGGDSDGDGQAIIVGGREFSFTPATLTATANTEFTIKFTNAGTIEHDFAIEGREPDKIVPKPGKTVSGSFTLPAGTYKFYCTVAGHEANGMKGTLTVK